MNTSFYTQQELESLGFMSVGHNVLISKKASIYGAEKMEIGSNVRVDDFCILSGNVKLGSFIHISAYSALFAGDAGITLMDFCGISSHSLVYAVSDDFTGAALANSTIPEKYRLLKKEKVVFRKHCATGAHCIVMPGVCLAEGTSVGAMSLVLESTQPWSVYFGSPARRVKSRSKDLLELEDQLMKEITDGTL